MKHLHQVDIQADSREEILPDYSADFPYLATCAELDRYLSPGAPWHWHRTLELFYVRSGAVEYITPKGSRIFPAGSGGLVNANVLHSTRVKPGGEPNVQYLHLFDPSFLAGERGSRIERKYILPLTSAPGLEILALTPGEPEQDRLLELLRESFTLSEEDWGYEFRLREMLTAIWMQLFRLARPAMTEAPAAQRPDALIKALMVCIHENYARSLTVDELAQAVHISRRACFRAFRENLHMTPLEYLREYRLGKACAMLVETDVSITQIGYRCGLGSSSYFGKVFREAFGCTPGAYRRNWHDRNKN